MSPLCTAKIGASCNVCACSRTQTLTQCLTHNTCACALSHDDRPEQHEEARGFRTKVESVVKELTGIGETLIRSIALCLGLPVSVATLARVLLLVDVAHCKRCLSARCVYARACRHGCTRECDVSRQLKIAQAIFKNAKARKATRTDAHSQAS